VDKFAKYKLTALPSKFVKPPIIAECRSTGVQSSSNFTTSATTIFHRRSPAGTCESDKVKANGERDESKLDPIVWLGRGFYKIGEKIGEYEGVKGISQTAGA